MAREQIELENIMFGDVWLCAGGSNMAQELNNVRDLNHIQKCRYEMKFRL